MFTVSSTHQHIVDICLESQDIGTDWNKIVQT